jgi:adenosine deaminase
VRELRALPKAHLHVHLEAAQRPATFAEWSERYQLPAPPEPDGTFSTFNGIARVVFGAARTPDDYARLLREMAEDARAEGVVWLEPSVWITPGMTARLGLPNAEAVLQLLLELAQDAARESGVGIGFQLFANRTHPPEEAVEQARLAARYAGRGVVAFGLADDEARGPAAPFAEAFLVARAAGLISAPHAGEHAGPESVRAALELLGAQRIQHGVRAIEDPDLVRRLADEQICLDVCPTSNVQLSVVPSLAEHPLPALVEAGLPVSLNADGPVIFGCTLLDEYQQARQLFGFDDATLAHIATCSIRASGAPASLRSAALDGTATWMNT